MITCVRVRGETLAKRSPHVHRKEARALPSRICLQHLENCKLAMRLGMACPASQRMTSARATRSWQLILVTVAGKNKPKLQSKESTNAMTWHGAARPENERGDHFCYAAIMPPLGPAPLDELPPPSPGPPPGPCPSGPPGSSRSMPGPCPKGHMRAGLLRELVVRAAPSSWSDSSLSVSLSPNSLGFE